MCRVQTSIDVTNGKHKLTTIISIVFIGEAKPLTIVEY